MKKYLSHCDFVLFSGNNMLTGTIPTEIGQMLGLNVFIASKFVAS